MKIILNENTKCFILGLSLLGTELKPTDNEQFEFILNYDGISISRIVDRIEYAHFCHLMRDFVASKSATNALLRLWFFNNEVNIIFAEYGKYSYLDNFLDSIGYANENE